MSDHSGRPPRVAVWLLSRLVRDEAVRDDLLADLHRGLRSRSAAKGPLRASLWYCRQAVGVVAHRVWARLFDSDVATVYKARRSGNRARHGPVRRPLAGAETLRRDVRYAFRAWIRSPGFTSVAVATIALGVGANAAIFSVVNGVLFTVLPYQDAERLVLVWPEKRWSGEMFDQVGERTTSFSGMSMYRGTAYTLLGDGEPEAVAGARVSVDHFQVLGSQPVLGRGFLPAERFGEGGGVAIISHRLWTRRYGANPNIIGRSVRISGMGRDSRTVVGVLPPDSRPLTNGDADVWTPVDMSPDSLEYAGQYGFSVVARLIPGRPVEMASAEVRDLVPEFTTEHAPQFREARFSPVDVVGLSEVVVRDIRSLLLTLLASTALVLLIACTNVANLLLARTIRRTQEISLRVALGAARGQIMRQVLVESVVLGLLGGLVGAGLALAAMPLLEAHVVSDLPRPPTSLLDGRVLVFTAGVSLLAGVVFGMVPALRATGLKSSASPGRGGRGAVGSRERGLVNRALVTAEVAVAVVLIVGASLVLKSFWMLTQEDVGFATAGLLTVEVALPDGRYPTDAERERYFTAAMQRLSSTPGVEAVSAVNYIPLVPGNAGLPYTVEGQDIAEGTTSRVFDVRAATPGHLRTLGLQLLEGRALDSSDRGEGDILSAVVSDAFRTRHWPGESALGKRVLTAAGDPFFDVVGVVSDAKHEGLAHQPHPTAYFTPWQVSWALDYLVVRTTRDATLLRSQVVPLLREVDPEVVLVQVRTMDEVVARSLGDARSVTSLFSVFAGLALLLGVVGVYGVTSYSVSQGLREVGLRLALGASRASVLGQTVRRAMVPVASGVAVGLLLSLGSSRVLQSLLFEVEPTDPSVLATVAGILTAAGVAASLVPAWRASRADPVSVLKGS